ncbi:hypothetical protein ACFXN2_05870 [Streptomyces kronopolitis]|uniref:hypothetical protein n=1 Tax=Streptomyces kronopolitis TaxID=1612435 RepID=UPI0036CF5615
MLRQAAYIVAAASGLVLADASLAIADSGAHHARGVHHVQVNSNNLNQESRKVYVDSHDIAQNSSTRTCAIATGSLAPNSCGSTNVYHPVIFGDVLGAVLSPAAAAPLL